jgi:short-subunit dehydrogenase
MAKQKSIAIITGASSGLGGDFARQIDAAYELDEIWIIARREAPLQALSKEIKRAKAHVLVLDLKEKSSWQAIEQKLLAEKPDVKFLVNNAGLGKIGPFAESTFDQQIEMIDLNVRSLTALTHIVLPFISSGGSIIQVASSIAFSPAANFAVYAATKSFVLSLSHALAFELRDQKIKVLAVCPGPVATEFFAIAGRAEDNPPAAIMAQSKDVVRTALRDLERGKNVSVYGLLIKLFVVLTKILPTKTLVSMIGKRR